MTSVLIADDSNFMRTAMTHILRTDPSLTVVGTANDGLEAVRRTKELRPDVLLMDIDMPWLDGLSALRQIMRDSPTRVVMISGIAGKDSPLAFKCLESGAIDFIAKPSGPISHDIDKIRDEILLKVKIAAAVDIQKVLARMASAQATPVLAGQTQGQHRLVVIGASTGGPPAVAHIVSRLPRDVPFAVLVVQHMIAEFLPYFAERLRDCGTLDVTLADDGTPISPGHITVTRTGFHMTFVPDGGAMARVRLTRTVEAELQGPSINLAMEAAALAFGPDVLGVLLTGMGDDGARGMKAIKDCGGATIAEDESTCVVYGMPKAAVALGAVDKIVPLPLIASAIMTML